MFFKKKQQAPVVRSAKVISLVDVLLQQKVLKIENSVFFMYRSLLIGKERKNIVKNLFFYARLKDLIPADGTLYIKDMEGDQDLIVVYNAKEGAIFLDKPEEISSV